MKVTRSKTGLPTLTESGGGMSNTGSARVIADERGDKVHPLFIPRGYANGDHAVFVVRPKMLIFTGDHGQWGYRVTVSRIERVGIDADPDELVLTETCSEENGDGNIPETLVPATVAVQEKMHCYHCREPHYVQ